MSSSAQNRMALSGWLLEASWSVATVCGETAGAIKAIPANRDSSSGFLKATIASLVTILPP